MSTNGREKPRLLVIPFADRYYPRETVDMVVGWSLDMLRELDIDLVTAPTVLNIPGAAKAAELADTSAPDGIILLVASWLEAANLVAAIKGAMHRPMLLWGHTSYEVPGEANRATLGAFVGASVIRETLEELDVKFKWIWGMPQETAVRCQVGVFARTVHAVSRMAKSRIGLLGYTALGMYTGTFDHVSLRGKIGPEMHHMDQWLLLRGMDGLNEADLAAVATKIRESWHLAPNVTAEEIDKAAKMYLSLKRLVGDNWLDALNVKCHYELSQIYGFTACIPLSLLADEVICTCEGDVMASVSQMMLAYLSGSPTVYGDIHQVLEDRLSYACCGLNPLAMSDPENRRISRWASDFQGITNSSTYLKGQKVTLARLASKGDSYKLHFTTGTTAPWSPLQEINSPPHAGTDVLLDDSGRWFAQNICSNHYAMVYGDYRQELELMAQVRGIRIVQ